MTIYYFGFKLMPKPIAPLIDAREMPNQYNPQQSDKEICTAIHNHPLFEGLVKNTIKLHQEHGTVYIGCTFGKHRSKAIAIAAAHILNTKAEPWIPHSPA